MTGDFWAALVPSIIAVLGALAAWLQAKAAATHASDAKQSANGAAAAAHLIPGQQQNGPPTPSH